MYIIAKIAITIIVNIGKSFTDNLIWIKKIGENRQMTDKQIIDGIDVSKCQHYGKCSTYCYVVDEPCSDNPNCYYKQLKRKEQECEALQMSENEAGEIIAELNAYKDINEDFKTAWEELKAENEELKKIINEAKNSN